MDHAAELTKVLAGERIADLGKTMRSLPAGIDAALVAKVVLMMIDRPFGLGRTCKQIPPRAIQEVLATETPGPNHLFLRLAVPTDLPAPLLSTRWAAALQALLDLDTEYAWGSRRKRAKFAKLAGDPIMLPAIQGTVAGSPEVSLAMLAVLAVDGSDTSYDALVSHIDTAFKAGDRRLDMLRHLRTHAAHTPALDALFAEIDGAIRARNDASPALALGPIIGVGAVKALWFTVSLASTRRTRNRVPWIQGGLAIDSRSKAWFSASLSTVEPDFSAGKSTRFDATELQLDQLGLGRCDPAALPRWLADAAARLDITWDFTIARSSLRGAKRDRVLAWLRGR